MHEAQLLEAAAKDPQVVLQAFMNTASHAVTKQGADVIVPAESVLASLLVEHKLTQVCGASVIDVLAIAWRSAIMMVRLRTDCNVKISRAGAYARHDPELVALMAR